MNLPAASRKMNRNRKPCFAAMLVVFVLLGSGCSGSTRSPHGLTRPSPYALPPGNDVAVRPASARYCSQVLTFVRDANAVGRTQLGSATTKAVAARAARDASVVAHSPEASTFVRSYAHQAAALFSRVAT